MVVAYAGRMTKNWDPRSTLSPNWYIFRVIAIGFLSDIERAAHVKSAGRTHERPFRSAW